MRGVKLSLWFIFRVLGLFKIAHRVNRGRLRILCYHGFEILDEASFRPKFFIKAPIFERRLATIKRYGFSVLPLGEAVEQLYSGTLPRHPLVITVDDGFHSFCKIAVPRLQQYDYPATVYVTTYYVQQRNPVFRLVVQYMFWKTRKRTLNLENVLWSDIHDAIDLTIPIQLERAMWDCIEYGERFCTETQRRFICEQLGSLLGVSYDQIIQSRILQLMTPGELQNLSASNIRVELHTHRHRLSTNDQVMMAREITDNRIALQKWLTGEKRHFCYPSGLWDERQWSWLNELEVDSATTCDPGLNDRCTPRYALRRFLDSESIHQLEFEAALSGFSDLVHNGLAILRRFVPRLGLFRLQNQKDLT